MYLQDFDEIQPLEIFIAGMPFDPVLSMPSYSNLWRLVKIGLSVIQLEMPPRLSLTSSRVI